MDDLYEQIWLLNEAIEKQKAGVLPRDNEELQKLQNLRPKALNKAKDSTEFLSNLDQALEAETKEAWDKNNEEWGHEREAAKVAKANKKSLHLEVPDDGYGYFRKKRAAEIAKLEDNENSSTSTSTSTKRPKLSDDIDPGTATTVKDGPSTDNNLSVDNSSTSNNSSKDDTSTGKNLPKEDSGKNPPKGGGESPKGDGGSSKGGEGSSEGDGGSPIDYVLEKPACDMPDLFDADGGD